PDPLDRIRSVVNSSDRAGRLAWELTADTLLYTATVAPEIADDIVNIDNAMRWGFNWDVGPFQTWVALGMAALAERMTAEGRTLPPLVGGVLRNGTRSFCTQPATRSSGGFTSQASPSLPAPPIPLPMAAL